MPLGGFLGVRPIARSDRNRVEARLAVAHQVAFSDDEPAAEEADAKILSPRQGRMNVQIHRESWEDIGRRGEYKRKG
jgi:hypothetical protein